LAAATFDSRGLHTDKALSAEFRARELKTKLPELQVHYSELLMKSQLGVAQIKSIPRFLIHGVKLSRNHKKAVENRPLNPLGMTLIEMIAVMAIIGILAAAVIPRIDFGGTSSQASVTGAAYMIASDIRYAQEFAMANRVSKSVQFSTVPPANVYTFSPTSNMDPSGRLPSGVTISTNYTVTFNSLGEPTTGGSGSVTVSAGGQSKTITVLQYTGKVNIS
jgi:prepilin-type N-terminal cleavage/methylation domain-containing protein